jgi:Flp pilus assembly protein TadD
MKRPASSLPTLPLFRIAFRTAALLAIALAGAQHATSRLTNPAATYAQSSPSSAPNKSKSQKLANPLNDLLDEAQKSIDANNFEAAVPPLQKFLSEEPTFAYAHFQLAYAYTALNRTTEARAEYERTIALDPKMTEAYLNLGVLLTHQDPAAAVAPLRKAVDMLPAQSRPRMLLAVAQERSGDLAGAATSFEGALHLDPKDLDATLHLANLYLNLKRPADAESKFRAALEIQPKLPNALLGLAKCLDAQEKPEAADAYRSYLEVAPEDSAIRAGLVHLLIDHQDYTGALAELDRADAGKPPTLDSLRLRADIQIAQKKPADAATTLRQAIVLDPHDAQLLGGLGRLDLGARNFPSAERELKAAIQIDRNNIAYWKDLASAYYLSGNYSAALATFDVIEKVEPPNAGQWFIRALCYDKLRQVKLALEAYQKFLSMDQGKNSDQIWQAQERSKVLKHMLEQKR